MTIDEKTLAKTLRGLGRTGEGVRRKLVAADAKGNPEHVSSCSIAVYLAAKFPDEEVFVTAEEITVNGASVTTPEGALDFITAFDAGRYPELVSHPDTCKAVRVEETRFGHGYVEYEAICNCETIRVSFSEKAEASAYARRARRALTAR